MDGQPLTSRKKKKYEGNFDSLFYGSLPVAAGEHMGVLHVTRCRRLDAFLAFSLCKSLDYVVKCTLSWQMLKR